MLKFLECFTILVYEFIFHEYVRILPAEDLNRPWVVITTSRVVSEVFLLECYDLPFSNQYLHPFIISVRF
jgi:hypothetical protein